MSAHAAGVGRVLVKQERVTGGGIGGNPVAASNHGHAAQVQHGALIPFVLSSPPVGVAGAEGGAGAASGFSEGLAMIFCMGQ